VQDRREDVAQNIQPALARGQIVLLDRYYFSTMAYQGARGLDPQVIQARNEAFAPPPDLLLLLELAPIQGWQRVQQRGAVSYFERLDYLERVAEIFARMAFPYLKRIPALQDPAAVHACIRQEVQQLLQDYTIPRQTVTPKDTTS
jgi:dTMP kinase